MRNEQCYNSHWKYGYLRPIQTSVRDPLKKLASTAHPLYPYIKKTCVCAYVAMCRFLD